MSKKLEEKELEKSNGGYGGWKYYFTYHVKTINYDGEVASGGFPTFNAACSAATNKQEQIRNDYKEYRVIFSDLIVGPAE